MVMQDHITPRERIALPLTKRQRIIQEVVTALIFATIIYLYIYEVTNV